MNSRYAKNKIIIVGGGIVGALEAYFAYLDAKSKGESIRVTVHEKNKSINDTTTSHIAPSFTIDEILAVVPRGLELLAKLKIPFNKPGGIQVTDVPNVNNTDIAKQFIELVQRYSQDEKGHQERTKVLLELGRLSMNLWQMIYDTADTDLKQILEESNFNPCREPKKNTQGLHDGYRVDLIYNIPNANAKACAMKADYEALGYSNCKILSPKEVMERDPYLTDFCHQHSYLDESGEYRWQDDAVALWRPGGCIDTQTFLPKFYDYLKKVMGQYTNEVGEVKNRFQLHLERHVVAVDYNPDKSHSHINGLQFFGKKPKLQKHTYDHTDYVFCPGESVGTLKKLGFEEPVYAGFAGASLMLNIPIPEDLIERYINFNHCMEVHQEGVVLAWQARFRDNKIFICVAGTKAFYGDQKPDKNQDFAKDRNLLQLNMVNDVLPEFISLALDRKTRGQKLGANYLAQLEKLGIAQRWVGTRAVAFDGFPTLGALYHHNEKVDNARTTTHLGSGGVSFSPACIFVSRSVFQEDKQDALAKAVLSYASTQRKC